MSPERENWAQRCRIFAVSQEQTSNRLMRFMNPTEPLGPAMATRKPTTTEHANTCGPILQHVHARADLFSPETVLRT